MQTQYSEGDRVILPANEQEKDEGGIVVQRDKIHANMYLVLLDECHHTRDPEDDGVREVHADQMKRGDESSMLGSISDAIRLASWRRNNGG
jgi:hypothetical protein